MSGIVGVLMTGTMKTSLLDDVPDAVTGNIPVNAVMATPGQGECIYRFLPQRPHSDLS
jgi:hypothetical protein